MTDPIEIKWIEESIDNAWALAENYFQERGRGALGVVLLEDVGKPAYFEQDWPHLRPELKQEIKQYSPGHEIVLVLSQPGRSFNIYVVSKNWETGKLSIELKHRI